MGGKTSKSTQTVSIPPEVLARYNAVNARAEEAAGRPFQPYSYNPADFVAQLTPTQLAGIQNVNYAAGQAQPYYEEATNQLMGAQMGAVPYYAQAGQDIGFGQQMGLGFQQQALQNLYGAQAAAAPLNYRAGSAYEQAYAQGQPFIGGAVGQFAQGQAQAQPYQQAAGMNIAGAQDIGSQLAQQAYAQQAMAGATAQPINQQAYRDLAAAYGTSQPLNQAAVQQYYSGLAAAQPLQNYALSTLGRAGGIGEQVSGQALGTLGQGLDLARPVQLENLARADAVYNAAQPFINRADVQYQRGLGRAEDLQQYALGTLGQGQQISQALSGQALESLQRGELRAEPLQQLAQGIYGQAYSAAQPFTQAALQQYYGGLGAAGPLSQMAQQNIAAAQAGASPYQRYATELGLAAARPVMPEALTGAQIQQYMSPYMSNVVGQTQALLNQQANQAQAEQLGNAIRSGAFGGDRAGIAAANLQQQQQLAQGKVLGDLLQSGFGQALGTAQQQQQLALSAEQANRAAQQAAAGQLLGVGQTGFGQGITAAQQQAALAQQLFGQQAATGQNIAGLGQQAFGQGLSTGQAQQALAQQLFGQGATTAAQQQAVSEALFGRGATAAAQQAALAQQTFGQNQAVAQGLAALGQQQFGQGMANIAAREATAQNLFGQSAQAAQQQAQIAQNLFGQGATQAAQQAALAQQAFGQNQAVGQNVAQMAAQLYGQGTGTAQAQAAIGQQAFQQQMQQAQQQAALSQLLFGQGTTAAQQQAALGQQLFGQGITGGQALLGAGQQAYQQGMGLGAAQQQLAQQLFGQGLSASQQQAALGQQGFAQQLAAAQARQGLGQGLYGMGAGTAQQLAALGAGAQGAALQGAQAQLAAGQAQQQTAQAGLQALYNQFLQQQAYPFQVAQFLGNIAMGTGALTGSTTTTTQPGSLFSDVRTKENLRKIGKTFDGQPVYAFNYKGDPKTQMGLIAQEVERKHPEAVGEVAGLKTVDYDRATRNAAKRGRVIDAEYTSSEGGSVTPHRAGLGFADGGMPTVNDPQKDVEEARQRQAAEASQKATEVAKEVARQPEKTASTPEVDLKPDLAAQKQSQSPTSVPSTLGIPTESRPAPQLAVASGDGLYKEDPRSKDAETILKAVMFAASLSDRRLKEDVKHIGYTDDGQKIYSYRIKGEPTTQIGLMADEVEKRHPDAVGSINGFKTVDYDRATEVAANAGRKKFADGGSPGLASPADMAALLAAQAQMFGPFSQFGRQNTGMPGMPGYVPGASLPVGSLVTAGDLPTQRSALDEFQKMLSVGKDVQDIVYPKPAPAPAPTSTPSTTTTETPGATPTENPVDKAQREFEEAKRYRGGAAYADGGQVIPYATPTSLNIPTEMKTPELMKAGQLGKQRSTMDDVESIVNIASDIKNLMKSTGGVAGRHGYQTDGRVGATGSFEDESFIDRLRRVAREIPQDVREMAGYGVTPQSAAAQREKLGPFSRNYVPAPTGGLAPTSAQPPAATTPPVVTPPAATTPTQVRTPPASQRPPVDVAPPPPAGGLVPPAAVAPPAVSPAVVPPAAPATTTPPIAPAGGLAPPAAAPATAPATGKTTEPPKTGGGLMNWLSKPENYIPLLQGAAAAATAPTQYTLPALLVGASAYGKSYQDVRQRLADIASTQATTKQTEAATAQINAERAELYRKNQVVKEADGREFVILGDGTRMLLGKWLMLSPSQRAQIPLMGQQEMAGLISGQPTAPPALGVPAETAPGVPAETPAQKAEKMMTQAPVGGQFKYLTPEGEEQLKIDQGAFQSASGTARSGMIEDNRAYVARVNEAADVAYNTGANLSQMYSALSGVPETGLLSGGALDKFKAPLVKNVNDLIRTIGGTFGASSEDLSPFMFNEQQIADGTATRKISAFLSFAMSKGASQNSLGALQEAAGAVPSMEMSRAEAEKILASLYIEKQRALDLANYIREARARAAESNMPESIDIANMISAFRRSSTWNDSAYLKKKDAVLALMQKKNAAGVSQWSWLQKSSEDPEVIDQMAADLVYGVKRDANGRIIGRNSGPIRGISNILRNN